MQLPRESVLLRIFIGESDRHDSHPLYEATSRLHTAKILRLSGDLPIIIEIVDDEARISEFLPVLDGMMGGGLVTLENVRVLRYRQGPENP
jgi:hypothetical protein